MKSPGAARAIGAVLLCSAGFWLALFKPYRERTAVVGAQSCRLETTIVDKADGATLGSVVLFHGISANRKVMAYLARGFAEQGLRVYVPDLPGHGRTPGPFTPARAEQCAEALVSELLTRGAIVPERTILAGHSMGGAIALRIAARIPVAGVLAVSPAPMRAAHAVSPENLLFNDSPVLPVHSLVMTGALELESIRGNATDLVASSKDGHAKYLEIPGATHLSVLFGSASIRAAQNWSATILSLSAPPTLPSRIPLAGALAGFAGILLIAGPLLREILGNNRHEQVATAGPRLSVMRLLLEFGGGAILTVWLLGFWIPMKRIGLLEGDYLASFLLLLGAALLASHWNAVRLAWAGAPRPMLAAALAGFLLLLVAAAWFDLTIYEAWLTASKWARFPLLLAVLFPYHLAEETLLPALEPRKKWPRLAVALSLRLIAWGAIMAGVLFFHSGEILFGLLSLYMALFNMVQRSGMDIVREQTRSAAAAAVFGAILQAGFCLVIFPIS